MRLFLLTFLCLYGALHYYIFTKIHGAFPMGFLVLSLIAVFLLLMVLAPFIIISSERHGHESFAQGFGYVGFLWMGFAFLFFSASMCVEIYRLGAAIGGFVFQKRLAPPTHLWRFLVPCIFAFLAVGYGIFEARHIRLERVVVKTPKISPAIGRLKIVQISDVHLGILVREERLERILKEVRRAAPDVLISSGDLVDGQMAGLHSATKMLEEIKPRFGKYAITGNHEYYAGLPQALEFTRRGGFTILRGEGVTIARSVNIAGIDDPTAEAYGGMPGLPEHELLTRLPRDKFTLFLKHRPVLDRRSLGLFDLQLSGHTHKGQVFPFGLLSRIAFPFTGGFFHLPRGTLLYTSRGSGTWGPPIRFLTPPEVTLFELVYEDGTQAQKGESFREEAMAKPIVPILESLIGKKGDEHGQIK